MAPGEPPGHANIETQPAQPRKANAYGDCPALHDFPPMTLRPRHRDLTRANFCDGGGGCTARGRNNEKECDHTCSKEAKNGATGRRKKDGMVWLCLEGYQSLDIKPPARRRVSRSGPENRYDRPARQKPASLMQRTTRHIFWLMWKLLRSTNSQTSIVRSWKIFFTVYLRPRSSI